MLSIFGIVGFGGLLMAQSNLSVLTAGASNITQTTAVLNGSYAVNLGGERSDRPQTFFQYGLSTSFGQSTPSRSHSRFSDSISVEVGNLVPNTTYYVRAVAQNRVGIVYGPTVSFVTLPTAAQASAGGVGSTVTVIQQPPGTVNQGGNNNQNTNTNTGNNNQNTENQENNNIQTGGANPVPTHISLDITDERETFTVGDILTYQVDYKNISETDIKDVFIKVELPDNTEFLSAGEGVYLRKEHSAVFDLGELEEDEDGDVKVNVRAVTALREGTKVAAAAIVLYTNPTNASQASAVHYDINEYDSDGRPASGSTKGGFLPGSFLGWLIIIIILVVIALIGRKIYLRYKEQKEEERAERELQEVINNELDENKPEDDFLTAVSEAPKSVNDIAPQFAPEEDKKEELAMEEDDPWAYDEAEEGEDDDLDQKKKDFLDSLPS